jgi:3-isopropylmalate dehydrogenase
MWRRVAAGLAGDYPDVAFDHMLVDNAAMQLVQVPERFDTLVMDNMFGDILSDEAAAVTGGLGLAGSASLGAEGPGIFEPVHGSAPDIAGQGIANPAGMLRSTALMLAHGLDRPDEGRRLDAAIDEAIAKAPTADVGGAATTRDFGDAVLAALG